jgi:hypothetical protein
VAERDALYSVVRSVGRMMLEGFPDVWGIIMWWYWEVSMTMVALPLSAGINEHLQKKVLVVVYLFHTS